MTFYRENFSGHPFATKNGRKIPFCDKSQNEKWDHFPENRSEMSRKIKVRPFSRKKGRIFHFATGRRSQGAGRILPKAQILPSGSNIAKYCQILPNIALYGKVPSPETIFPDTHSSLTG